MPPTVFVNYRATDSLAVADRVAKELQRAIDADSVFLDHRSIEPGDPWPDKIKRRLDEADIVLALIGKQWLSARLDNYQRRINQDDDWVRIELARAFKAKKRVYVVYIDNQPPLDEKADLPADIAELYTIQKLELRNREWDKDFAALCEVIGVEPSAPGGPGSSTTPPPSNVPNRFDSPFVGRDDDLGAIVEAFSGPETSNLLVLHGPSGVGKSELAREYAREYGSRYPGGTFFVNAASSPPVDLIEIGRTWLGLTYDDDQSTIDRCKTALYKLGGTRTLLILDNVDDDRALKKWLPAAAAQCDVLATSLRDYWPTTRSHTVERLKHDQVIELVAEIGGDEIAEQFGEQIVQSSDGRPMQIRPVAASLALQLHRGREAGDEALQVTTDLSRSFQHPYEQLDDDAKVCLHAITLYRRVTIPESEIAALLEAAIGNVADLTKWLDECAALRLIELDGGGVNMHRLVAEFLAATGHAQQEKLEAAFADRLLEAAQETVADLGSTSAAERLALMSADSDAARSRLAGGALVKIGRALRETGRFDEACDLFQRVVAEAEQGQGSGVSLARNLHEVGFCYAQVGDHKRARAWFERSVQEKERGDEQGNVDHDSLARSLHEVGVCYSHAGDYKAARGWYERAVAEVGKGNASGDVDHEMLGKGLHEVGWSYSQSDDYETARDYYAQAVDEKKQGDVRDRVDHASVGRSLHQVGYCYSNCNDPKEARDWYERAVVDKEKGDIHGRIDHESLGRSLHSIGVCHIQENDARAALEWFERAVDEKRQGDVHGRVDHDSLGRSLHEVGICYANRSDDETAMESLEQAVAAKRKGNVHGRVDQDSLALSQRSLETLSRTAGA